MNDQQLATIKTALDQVIGDQSLKNVFITKDQTVFEITAPQTHGTISLAKNDPSDFYLKLEPNVGGVVSGQSANLSDLLHEKVGVLADRFKMQNEQPLNFSGLLNQSDTQLISLKNKFAENAVPEVNNDEAVAYQNDIELILTERYNQVIMVKLIELFNQFHQQQSDNTALKTKVNKGLYQFINPFKSGNSLLHTVYEANQKTPQSILKPTTMHDLIVTEETIVGLKSYLDQVGYFDRTMFNVKNLNKLDKVGFINPIVMNARNNFKLWSNALFKFETNTQRKLVDYYRTQQPESHDNKMNLGHYYYENILKLI